MEHIKAQEDGHSVVALAICIGKARDRGMRELTVEGMKDIMEVISDNEDCKLDGVNVSSLTRCAVQLLLKCMTHGDNDGGRTQCLESAKMLSVVLAQGLKIIHKQQGLVRNEDIIWIISKAYNSALHQSQEENTEISLELTDLALKVISLVLFFATRLTLEVD